jgi:hypothetical protein
MSMAPRERIRAVAGGTLCKAKQIFICTGTGCKAPLQGVTVTIPGHDLVTLTDEDGYYLFDDLVTGTYRITCSLTGYQIPGEQKAEITVDVTSLDVDYSLEAVEVINAA